MIDKFLQCSNCVRWGQPWKLHHRMVLCESRKDEKGDLYYAAHEACRYFVPKQQEIPKELQVLRLFVQSLSPTQISYLKFAATQAQAVMDVRDSEGDYLSLGDSVTFSFEDSTYFGSVEGVDPQSGGLCVNCRSFSSGNAIVPSRLLRRISKADIFSDLMATVEPEELEELSYHLAELIKPISELRARRDLKAEDHRDLLKLEERYSNLRAKLRYKTTLLASVELARKTP